MTDRIEVSPDELSQLLTGEKKPFILDVRDEDECIQMLPDAVNIPMPELAERINELPRNRVIVTVCLSGLRSMRVTKRLRDKGYTSTLNLCGGLIAWKRKVDPSFRL